MEHLQLLGTEKEVKVISEFDRIIDFYHEKIKVLKLKRGLIIKKEHGKLVFFCKR